MDVLNTAGITIKDIKPQYQSFEDSKESLKDGKIDAAFIVAGAPTTAITELATTNGVYLINIDGDLRDKILKECPYYTEFSIPAGTYPKQDEAVETITIGNCLAPSLLVNSHKQTKPDLYRSGFCIF